MNDFATCSFAETGAGEPVVCLLGENAAALMDALTDDFHVLALRPSQLQGADAQSRAQTLSNLIDARGLENFAVMAHGDDALIALHVAAAQSERVNALVLLSPTPIHGDHESRDGASSKILPDVKAQTLALFGTRDHIAPPSTGGAYKRALAACHLVYVFDAADTASERLEAVSEVVLDFLKRRDAFLVNNADGRVFA